ncbi:MAG: hypothetical protein QOD61_1433 [Solirubrobacteraceae bacterium]|jgi:hypothetical protein|nr:hypothetical protein [Solirubrobacteraceae bacterium]
MPRPRTHDEHRPGRPPPPPVARDQATRPTAEAGLVPTAPGPSVALRLIRYGLPGAILLAGVILSIAVPGETGVDALVGLGGVAACVLLLNVLLRLGASGDRDRMREAAARAYYDEHGRWPDDQRPAR